MENNTKQPLRISVAIVTRNRANLLKVALDALREQSYKPFEILVIDNASTDSTKSTVLNFNGTTIKYLYEPKIGIPIARNRALRGAVGDILAFTDDDCIPPKNWLKNISKAFENFPEVAAVQGESIALSPESIKSILFQTNYNYWIWKNTYNKKYLTICDTNNFSFRTGIIKRLGIRFDPKLNRGSDVDFAKKIIKNSQKILYAPSVKNFHAMRSNWITFLHQRFKMGKAQVYLNKRWPDSNENKEFYKDYYQLSIKQMLEKKQGFQKLMLYFAYKIYHPLFWILVLSAQRKKSFLKVSPEKYRMDKKVVSVSVAIVTKNREVYLKQCLNYLLKQTVLPREIVIVDNASTDNTKKVYLNFKKLLPLKYVYESRIGTAFARNKALMAAKENIVAFIDDDCQASSNWLDEVYKAHNKFPEIAAIQGKCQVIPYKGVFSFIYEIAYQKWLNNLKVGTNKLLTLDTANASFKKSLLNELSVSFDHQFVKYCDDEDFSQQLLFRGQKIIYWPKAVVGSRRRQSKIEYFKERFRKGVAKAYFDGKWARIIQKRFMLLNEKKILLGGLYKPNKMRLRMLFYKAHTDTINSFFNKSRIDYITYYKIKLVAFFFEYLYHSGYFITKMKIQFEKLDKVRSFWPNQIKNNLSLAVMIITKNRYSTLAKTLDSLIKQKKYLKEVIIVDSSEEMDLSLINQYKKKLPIRHVYEKKSGFGIARNTALYLSKSDIIATLDDDAVAATDWSKNILKAHYHSDAVAIVGRIICMPFQSAIASIEQIRLDKWLLGNMNDKGLMTTLSTKNVSFKLNELLNLGIKFEENPLFGKYGSEDLDIANQILINNKKIQFDSSIKIFHRERKNIFKYLSQQYRKGCSNAILELAWKDKITKKSYYLDFNKKLEPFLLLASHPYLKTRKSVYLTLLIFFFLSLFFFNYGKKRMHFRLKKENSQILKIIQPNTNLISDKNVGILFFNSDETQIRRSLYLLSKQSLLPKNVYVFAKKGLMIEKKLIRMYRKFFQVRIYNVSENLQSSNLNKYIKKTKVLCMLSDFFEPDINWIKNIKIAHGKYPDKSAVQGRTVYANKSIEDLIHRFNSQSLIRNKMNGDKKRYWDWMAGKLKKDFTVRYIDYGNLSIKKSLFKSLKIDQENGLVLDKATEPILVPSIIVSSPRNITSAKAGPLYIDQNLESNVHSLLRMKILFKRLAAFTNYCLKNHYYIKFPLLTLVFLFYEIRSYYNSNKIETVATKSLNKGLHYLKV